MPTIALRLLLPALYCLSIAAIEAKTESISDNPSTLNSTKSTGSFLVATLYESHRVALLGIAFSAALTFLLWLIRYLEPEHVILAAGNPEQDRDVELLVQIEQQIAQNSRNQAMKDDSAAAVIRNKIDGHEQKVVTLVAVAEQQIAHAKELASEGNVAKAISAYSGAASVCAMIRHEEQATTMMFAIAKDLKVYADQLQTQDRLSEESNGHIEATNVYCKMGGDERTETMLLARAEQYLATAKKEAAENNVARAIAAHGKALKLCSLVCNREQVDAMTRTIVQSLGSYAGQLQAHHGHSSALDC